MLVKSYPTWKFEELDEEQQEEVLNKKYNHNTLIGYEIYVD